MLQRPSFRLIDDEVEHGHVQLSPKESHQSISEKPEDAPRESTKRRMLHSVRIWLPVLLYASIAVTTLTTMVYLSFFAATVDGATPTMTGCRYFGYWTGPTCGLNGIDCQPFESDWKPIRCPTRCLWGMHSIYTKLPYSLTLRTFLDGSSALEVIGSGPYKYVSRSF
jgi:hypothetical protein